jgi:PAS domain S-box-containing protein
MQRLDVDTASRAGRFTDELRDTIEHTGWQVLWISIAIAALSSLMAIWFVRSGIQRPLVNVLARIHAIRSGSVLPGAPLKPRSDEWGTIDSALSDMSDDLVKTRNLLQQIIDALPIRVFWKDRESRYLGCNPLFARDAGKHAPSELIGRNDYVMTWAEQAELYRADDKLVMETGLPRLNYEEPQTTPSKEEIWLRTSKVPLLDPSGSVFGVLGIYDDITIRKQAELALQRSEQRLRLALDAARQSWFDANLRTGEVRVSEQYPRLLDYEPEAFDTSIQNWMDNIHPEDAGGVRAEFMKLLQTGGPAIMDYRRRNKAGEWIWLQSTAKVVEWDADGHALRLAGIHQDVTARKLSEIELEQHRHHLEELVEKRTLELESAKVAAEVANRAKSTFLANMSHELRTPINGVMGMLGLAKRRMIDPKGIEQLTKAQFAADHLFAVLNDILDLSKIEADRLTVEHVPLQLRGVLDNLVSVIGNSATEKGLLLSVDLPDALASIPLLGDPLRIGQVLLNLTGNAIKFTDHGSINVRVRQQESAQDEVLLRFEVTDTGIGIAPADQGRLFSAFEQADASMTRKYGGTGLGLAISRRLVLLMDGKIGVDSAQGEGSTFWFTARLQRQDRGAPQPEPVVDEADVERRLINEYKGAVILLAEDEPVNREIACVLLEQVGLAVDQAEDGKEALNLARRKPYALILMDMQMPNMNGIEAARAIRADSLNRNTPILATTANAFAEDRQVCFAAGMNDHLAKPVRPGKLYEMLLKWLDTGKAG